MSGGFWVFRFPTDLLVGQHQAIICTPLLRDQIFPDLPIIGCACAAEAENPCPSESLLKTSLLRRRQKLILQIRMKLPQTFFIALFSFFSPFLVPASSRMLLAPAPAEFPAQGFPLFSIGAFSFPACSGLLICYRGLWTSLDRCLHPAGKNCRGNGTKNKILVLGKKKAPTIAGNTYDFGKAFQLWLNRLRRGILQCQHCLDQLKV